MRNLWILTRFLLKSGPGKSNQKSGKKKAFSDGGRIVVYLLLGVCLLPVSVLLFFLGYSGYTFLQPLGLETLLIEFVCAIGMMVIFFYGLPLFLSEYYMDSDLVKLLPLPFTPAKGFSWSRHTRPWRAATFFSISMVSWFLSQAVLASA